MPPTGWGGVAHPFAISKTGPNVVVLNGPDLTVTAFPVDHEPVEPAVGYLFVYKGRRLVVSGDTAPSPRLEAVARGADVLTHEGLAPNLVAVQREAALKAGKWNTAAILHDILSYHTTPEAAAGIAASAPACATCSSTTSSRRCRPRRWTGRSSAARRRSSTGRSGSARTAISSACRLAGRKSAIPTAYTAFGRRGVVSPHG